MEFMRHSPAPGERYQPSKKMLNKTAATGFSYLSPQTCKQQQHLLVARSISAGGKIYNYLA